MKVPCMLVADPVGPVAERTINRFRRIADEGIAGVYDALGPSTPGTTRYFRLDNSQRLAGGAAGDVVAVTKQNYEIPPVSPRFGSEILTAADGSRFGYVHLRTFIDTAEAPLLEAFAEFEETFDQDAPVGLTEIVPPLPTL